ncbi:MAG: hypothetical protein AAF799_07750 [Myxococcota bacterium]
MTAVLLAAFVVPTAADAQAPSDAVAMTEDGQMVVPMVKVEIQHKGRVLKSKPQRMDWDEAGSVRLERGERVHDVTVQITRKDEQSKKLKVTLTYELDGELVIEDYAYDTKPRKREVLRTDGVALAVTVTPKAIDDGSPNQREDKLEGPTDPNDPLAGL